MDISTTSIETAIAMHTRRLVAARGERHRINIGTEACQNVGFRTEELTSEITRLEGQINGLSYALGEIKAQQQGYANLEAQRNVVETIRLVPAAAKSPCYCDSAYHPQGH